MSTTASGAAQPPRADGAEGAARGRIAVGVGCRAGCGPEQVIELLHQALAAQGRTLAEVQALHTADFKRAEPGLQAAAARLQKPLIAFTLEQLRAHAAGALSQSEHTLQRFGVPSIAETAALAGAAAQVGSQRPPRLLGARQSSRAASCALAEAGVDAQEGAQR